MSNIDAREVQQQVAETQSLEGGSGSQSLRIYGVRGAVIDSGRLLDVLTSHRLYARPWVTFRRC